MSFAGCVGLRRITDNYDIVILVLLWKALVAFGGFPWSFRWAWNYYLDYIVVGVVVVFRQILDQTSFRGPLSIRISERGLR